MRGVITGKDVVLHSVTIVRLFGMATYLTCLWAAITRRPSTFLGSVYAAPARTSLRWRPSR
jgi:hypothetical protein